MILIRFLLVGAVFIGGFWSFQFFQKQKERGPAGVVSDLEYKFMYSSFGGINKHTAKVNALPWPLAKYLVENGSKALGVIEDDETWKEGFKAMGFLFPETVSGRATVFPENPAGLAVERVKIPPFAKYPAMNITCAACHSSVAYDSTGIPNTKDIWLGAPSPSINYQLYIDVLYAGIQNGIDRKWRGLRSFVKGSGMNKLELFFAKDAICDYFEEQKISCEKSDVFYCKNFKDNYSLERPGVLLSYSAGGPGLTNGVATLGYYTNQLARLGSVHGFTSVPSFADRSFKSSFLYDGFYKSTAGGEASRYQSRTQETSKKAIADTQGAASVIAMFTIPIMGNSVGQLEKTTVDQLGPVMPLLWDYSSHPFPGQVQKICAAGSGVCALEGIKVYTKNCASCHGVYQWKHTDERPYLESYPNEFSNLTEIGTDPSRAQSLKADIVNSLLSKSPLKAQVSVLPDSHPRGYVAPPLGDLWLSAPYLHNGSVPTLWHLMHPEQRPKRFLTGGHSLDFEKVGIAYSEGQYLKYKDGYEPYSRPYIYDTQEEGKLSNGHEKEFTKLSEDEKKGLMEFLKLL